MRRAKTLCPFFITHSFETFPKLFFVYILFIVRTRNTQAAHIRLELRTAETTAFLPSTNVALIASSRTSFNSHSFTYLPSGAQARHYNLELHILSITCCQHTSHYLANHSLKHTTQSTNPRTTQPATPNPAASPQFHHNNAYPHISRPALPPSPHPRLHPSSRPRTNNNNLQHLHPHQNHDRRRPSRHPHLNNGPRQRSRRLQRRQLRRISR